MKALICLALLAPVLASTVGCDESKLSDDLKTLAQTAQVDSGDSLQLFTETLAPSCPRLLDGSCTGDGNQYGGVNGQGIGNRGNSNGSSNGNGAGHGIGDRDRLRDGSCVDSLNYSPSN